VLKILLSIIITTGLFFFGREEILEGSIVTAGGRHLAMRARGIEIRPLISCVGEEFY
jgi:hypothetical protein